jgi:protein O-mannosyl-transferase
MSKKKNVPNLPQNATTRPVFASPNYNQQNAKLATPPKDFLTELDLNNEGRYFFKAPKYFNIALSIIVGAISFFVFKNSFDNTFVLDDHGIIKSNKITKGGINKANLKKIFTTSHRAGDVSELEHSLYRPVVKTIFTWLWEKSGGADDNYRIFHKFNVFAYAVMCMLLFWVLLQVFKQNWVLAFLSTVLFTVHPLHSEVVANNKSLDEILGLLGPLAAILCYSAVVRSENILFKIIGLLGGAFFFLFGLLSKESAMLVFPLIPLFAYYFNNAKMKDIILITLSCGVAMLIWYLLRDNAIGWFLADQSKKPDPSALDNVLALCKADQTKKGNFQFSSAFPTVLFIMGRYVYTLFYPYPLSCDYSFATIEPKSFGDWEVWASIFMFAGLIYFAVRTFLKKNPVGFGIIWFLLSSFIASNITVLIGYIIGTSFGDRMMFTPSMGWSIAVVGALYYLFGYAKKGFSEMTIAKSLARFAPLFGIIGIASAVYGMKAISRNADWKRDFTLFAKDVENYPNSTHLLFYWGNHLSSNEYMEGKSEADKKVASTKALETFKRSMTLYPALPSDGYNQYGKCYYNLGYVDSAEKYYMKAHKEDSTNSVFMNNLGTIYFQRANAPIPPTAPDPVAANNKRMSLYDDAFKFFNKAYNKDTTVVDYQNNIGAVLGTLQKFPEAIQWFEKAYRSDSLSEGAILSCRSIAVTYKTLQNPQMEQFWTQKAATVQAYRNQKLAERM